MARGGATLFERAVKVIMASTYDNGSGRHGGGESGGRCRWRQERRQWRLETKADE